jgi:hypothetical protein
MNAVGPTDLYYMGISHYKATLWNRPQAKLGEGVRGAFLDLERTTWDREGRTLLMTSQPYSMCPKHGLVTRIPGHERKQKSVSRYLDASLSKLYLRQA